MHMTLLLLEDDLNDVEELQQAVEGFDVCTDQEGRRWHFTLEYLPGDKEISPDGKYQDYDERIFSRIREKIEQQTEEEKIGVLLDVMLNADERESGKKLYSYPETKLAPEIYKEFCDSVPIYAITSIPHFYTQCQRIMMGVNMSDRFIYKPILLEYKVKSEIKKLQDFYINWTGEQH